MLTRAAIAERMGVKMSAPASALDQTPLTRSGGQNSESLPDVAVNETGEGGVTDSGAIRSGLVPELKPRPPNRRIVKQI
jgi:hypothetical protein